MNEFVLICPNCEEFVIIEKINCGIFRHGMFKSTGAQIDPHSSKSTCDFYVFNNLIFGCGKPFQIIHNQNSNTYSLILCDYK